MSAPAMFSPRVLLGWVTAVVAVFALAICLLAFGGGESQRNSVGPSAQSRSAIGYAGLAELLRRTGVTVASARYGDVDEGAAGKLLVLADPAMSALGGHYSFGNADRVLVILPKWYGSRSLSHSGWISDTSPVPIGFDDEIIRKAGATGRTARVDRPENWTTNTLGVAPEIPAGAPVQVIENTGLRPVVAAGGQVLVGEVPALSEAKSGGSRRIWIVSDPDILSNHGLFLGRNVEFATGLVNALRPAQAGVVFSELAYGTPAPSTAANPLTMMLQFPFIIVTLQLLGASALLLWAAMPRFGVPVPAPEMLAAGKQRLVQNAATLLRFSSHPEIVVANYVRLSVRGVARELRSPPALDWQRLVEWLAQVGKSRRVAVDFPGLVRRAEDLATSRPGSARTLADIAHETHRWKREILNGP